MRDRRETLSAVLFAILFAYYIPMAGKKRIATRKAADKIARIIENALAALPASVREARLTEIHRIASSAGQRPAENL